MGKLDFHVNLQKNNTKRKILRGNIYYVLEMVYIFCMQTKLEVLIKRGPGATEVKVIQEEKEYWLVNNQRIYSSNGTYNQLSFKL